nr:hypothetical protein [Tepidimonas sp.]
MLAHVGHFGLPSGQLGVEVLQVTEHAPGHEVALDVLHAGLDLALRLGAIRLAQPWREAPVRREGGERRVQPRLAPAAAQHDGAHAVVQQKLAAAAKVGERGLVSRQQLGHAFVQETLRKAAPAVAQGHHEDVDLGAHAAQRHRDLAPVALRLLARAGLKARLRQRGHRGGQAQRRHRAAHDDVAAGKPALRAQLLPQDACRVVDLGRTLGQPLAVRIQQAGRFGAPVRLPRRLTKTTAHRLAIELQFTGNGRDAATSRPPLVNRLPLL